MSSLAELFPEIASEWHECNTCSSEEVSPHSGKKYWWRCKFGHSYESQISNRTGANKTGCPYCSGARVSDSNSLVVLFPEIAAEWHPIKNKLSVNSVSFGTKRNFWWLGKCGHEWMATPKERIRNDSFCPVCNSLAVKFPHLIAELHPTANSIASDKISARSGKKLWWVCEKGHSYQATVCNRTTVFKNKNGTTRMGSGCPYCSGAKVCEDNNLAVLFPKIAAEWHPTKNDKAPNAVTPCSKKKVWWLGKCGHEWDMTVQNRLKYNCPFCRGLRVCDDNSFATLCPDIAKEWHPTKNILSPSKVTKGSHKRVWWLCRKCHHEWATTVNVRSN